MAKKFIDIMDTSMRDGFQSVFGARVKFEDFAPCIQAARHAGLTHIEFGGGARFQAPMFYLNENPFEIMDKFRELAGPDADLQTLSRGVNTVALDTAPHEVIEMHAKLFKKHGTTTIRNFDALNDARNLDYSGRMITKYGLKHEVTVTLMDLPPGLTGAHDVKFYEQRLRAILDAGIPFTSVCFKDASGTSSPEKIYQTFKMAKKLLPEGTHVRLHSHETAGVGTACYLAALEGGADGLDCSVSPVSEGTGQPDMVVMLHAMKGKNYETGLDIYKVREYEEFFKEQLKDYFIPPEARYVSPMITFSPMPGGALTANTQMMRDFNLMDKYEDVIKEMQEVVSKGGFGTSVTPVSQFYFQQAFSNVVNGRWKQITDGYGRMVLGYFGHTPCEPDPEVVKIAAEQLKLEPTSENPVDIADRDEKKSAAYWKKQLEEEGIPTTEENIFIAVSGASKGIVFLKGKAQVQVRKLSTMPELKKDATLNMDVESRKVMRVSVNDKNFEVQVETMKDKEKK